MSKNTKASARTMSNPPSFGIVVPVLNQARYLEGCLRSVWRQDYDPALVRVAVVDAGSDDGSIEIVQRSQERIAAHLVGVDTGQSNAINLGIAALIADGAPTVVSWLNADDLLLPGCLRRIAETVTARPAASIYSSDLVLIDAEDRVLKCARLPAQGRFATRLGVFTLAQPALFYRTEAWHQVGGLDESYHLSMDIDLWYRLFHHGATVAHTPAFLGAFRVHPAAKTEQSRAGYAPGQIENKETQKTRAAHAQPLSADRVRLHRAVVRAMRAASGGLAVSVWHTLRWRGRPVSQLALPDDGRGQWP